MVSGNRRALSIFALTIEQIGKGLGKFGIPRAQVIIEAIVEKVEAKRSLFRDLEAKASNNALLATNTSSIPLETIAEGLTRPSSVSGVAN